MSDAPHVAKVHLRQRCGLLLVIGEVADSSAGGVLLGGAVRDLGEGLGRADPHAHRDPSFLEDGGTRLPGEGGRIGKAREAEEGLVNRVHLQVRREVAQHAHHPGGEVAVEGVVGTAHLHAPALELGAAQVPGVAHLDPERLGLVAARDHAAVVIGQHHHRHAAQLGLKQPLARGVEVVAVDEGDWAAHGSKHPHRTDHDAPDLELGLGGDRDVGERLVFWAQPRPSASAASRSSEPCLPGISFPAGSS